MKKVKEIIVKIDIFFYFYNIINKRLINFKYVNLTRLNFIKTFVVLNIKKKTVQIIHKNVNILFLINLMYKL